MTRAPIKGAHPSPLIAPHFLPVINDAGMPAIVRRTAAIMVHATNIVISVGINAAIRDLPQHPCHHLQVEATGDHMEVARAMGAVGRVVATSGATALF